MTELEVGQLELFRKIPWAICGLVHLRELIGILDINLKTMTNS